MKTETAVNEYMATEEKGLVDVSRACVITVHLLEGCTLGCICFVFVPLPVYFFFLALLKTGLLWLSNIPPFSFSPFPSLALLWCFDSIYRLGWAEPHLHGRLVLLVVQVL